MRRLANAADEIEDARKGRARFQSTFGSALDRGAVGERIAKGHAKLDDVRACFSESENEFQGGIERRIAGCDVGDDAKLAGRAQCGEAFGDAGRVGRHIRHSIRRNNRD